MAFCVNCGKKVPEGVSFCPYCGTNLKEILDQFGKSRQEDRQQESSAPETSQMSTQQIPYEQTPCQQPPSSQQAYRPPYYIQKDGAGYLYQKPQAQPVPARGMGTLGKLAGIFGMISSIVLMVAMLVFISADMDKGVTSLLASFEDKAVLLFAGALEGLVLSFLGIFLSHRAAGKGNPSTSTGRRLGIAGLVLSALNVVDLILFLIVLFMS